MRLPSLSQAKALAGVVRDWAALLYTPVLSLYAVWLTATIVWLYPWAEATQARRIDFLGGALIATLCLIGLGTLFYQRRKPPNIRARLPAAELEISTPDAERPAPEGRERGRRGPRSGAGWRAGARP